MTPTSAAAPEGIGLRAFNALPDGQARELLHHFGADLAPFGLDNPGEVFYAADRPYGLIEATVIREDAPDPGLAWSAGLT